VSDSTSNGPVKLFVLQFGVHPLTHVPVAGYLIEMADRSRALVDTGFSPSSKGSTRGLHWFRITPEDHVSRRLDMLGLDTRSVQYVISSHFDPDHCGGHDLFPHARFFVQRRHYEIAVSGQYARFQMQREHWDDPALNYELLNGDEEVLPGIRLIETSGHVPGHQSVLLNMQSSRKVLLTIDAMASAAAADPATYTGHPFDMDPEEMRKSIRKLRSIMASEEVDQVVFGHDPEQWGQLRQAPAYYS
jgi:N-acyl homoserine lactone hydrolase